MPSSKAASLASRLSRRLSKRGGRKKAPARSSPSHSPSLPPTPRTPSVRASPNPPSAPSSGRKRFDGFVASPLSSSSLSSRHPTLTPPHPFDGFVPSPSPSQRHSSRTDSLVVADPLVRTLQYEDPPSPAKHRLADGSTLNDFANVLFDVCELTAAVFHPSSGRIKDPEAYFHGFHELLVREGIRCTPQVAGGVYAVRMHTPDDMHRLMCKLPYRLRTVTKA